MGTFWVLTESCRTAKMKSAGATCAERDQPGCKSLFPKLLICFSSGSVVPTLRKARRVGAATCWMEPQEPLLATGRFFECTQGTASVRFCVLGFPKRGPAERL